MHEFLKTEYEKCIELLRYYDERHHTLVMFTAGMSSGVPSLLMTLHGLTGTAAQYFWEFSALVSAITALGLLSIFTVIVQLRLYFVYPARQVNALRKMFLSETCGQFSENQMYLDTSFNAFKWNSAHTLLNVFVSLQIGAFFGLTLFCLNIKDTEKLLLIYYSGGFGTLAAITTFGLSARYLYTKSKQHADVSVHERKIKNVAA